jgi:hypothetical protein
MNYVIFENEEDHYKAIKTCIEKWANERKISIIELSTDKRLESIKDCLTFITQDPRQNEKIDLAIIDIQLDRASANTKGYQLVPFLSKRTKVVIATSYYDQYEEEILKSNFQDWAWRTLIKDELEKEFPKFLDMHFFVKNEEMLKFTFGYTKDRKQYTYTKYIAPTDIVLVTNLKNAIEIGILSENKHEKIFKNYSAEVGNRLIPPQKRENMDSCLVIFTIYGEFHITTVNADNVRINHLEKIHPLKKMLQNPQKILINCEMFNECRSKDTHSNIHRIIRDTKFVYVDNNCRQDTCEVSLTQSSNFQKNN